MVKNLTNVLTDEVLKANAGNINLIYKTNLLSIQFSSSIPKQQNEANIDAIKNRISVIDFSSCESVLKKKGLMVDDDYITYSKIDWNAFTSDKNYSNANMTKSSSVSYNLYFSNRTLINLTLCANTTTDVKIPLANIGELNMTLVDNLAEKGVNAFDPNAEYFTDRCVPLTVSDKEAVIQL